MSTAEENIRQSMADSMTPEEKARADAIMTGWFAFNKRAREIEDLFKAQQDEVATAVDEVICKTLGIDDSPIADRIPEFGRLLSDIYRTYQMRLPYAHQANDALIKEQLKTFSFALDKGVMQEIIKHDVDSMYEILHERVYWVEKTGDISLALDAVTTPTCFRNLTIGEGFQWHGDKKVSWLSPYKRILEKGWKRGIWSDVTEEKIHQLWTKPRFEAYAKHLECHFDISDWDEETRLITIEVSPL
ncbi:MAG: hypothetical protein QF790_08225 [Gammaproteobacteria bacterium]|jgi:hypothetical protein|nr:hypothetical protein [Gammaproteobacteria bacterium]MDP6617133.1 hypothetical protein [Gammaproteobacteria bacterium]MDP6695757.1 hypothetical protein [Gammaproteobacteria bacterium]